MSTSYSSCLVIGVPFREMDILYDEIENLGLNIFNPDPGDNDPIVGIDLFESPPFGYIGLPADKLDETISLNSAKFFAITGKVGKLYLTMNFY